MKRTWEVRYACTNNVHLRFLLPQVAPHLLGSERPLFEPSLELVAQKMDVLNLHFKLRAIDRWCTRAVHVDWCGFDVWI